MFQVNLMQHQNKRHNTKQTSNFLKKFRKIPAATLKLAKPIRKASLNYKETVIPAD